jgi:Holliday junction resolvasome RuvABC endonuclease subunit
VKILGLDVSTKTGYAVMESDVLIEYGLLKSDAIVSDELEDFLMLKRAEIASNKILQLIEKHKPDFIFCEQTNAGKFRGSQKQLEFIHCKLLTEILNIKMSKKFFYVDTSKWRSKLGVKLSKEQKKHNKNVKIGTSKGKITPKHLVVSWVNEKFNLKMLKKDHDICDAIAICVFGKQATTSVQKYDLDNILKN